MARKYLLKPDRIDERDLMFSAESMSLSKLPASVDLRSKMSPVVDQGSLGSCTANAIACGLKESLLFQKGDQTRLSRLFLYWQERFMEDTVGEDSGAMIRDGFRVLKKIGCAPEADFPYDIAKFTETPTEKSVQDAAAYKISSYYRVMTLNSLKSALAKGLPVVFGMMVYDSFESREVAKTGLIPVPNKQAEQCLGGHAICAVGYDDAKQVVIVRNSWGTDWGDNGHCYIPYAVFQDRELVPDMWTGR